METYAEKADRLEKIGAIYGNIGKNIIEHSSWFSDIFYLSLDSKTKIEG